MGKIRKFRRKLHASAVKAKENQGLCSQDVEMSESRPAASVKSVTVKAPASVRIQSVKDLLDDDGRSCVTSKSFRGLNLKKKDKMKVRRDLWMQKMDATRVARAQEQQRAKRRAAPVVGDLKPLEDSLPTLDLLLRDYSSPLVAAEEQGKSKKLKCTQKVRTRQKQAMQDIDLFKQIVQDPSYKADPLQAMNTHLRNKLEQEREQRLSKPS